MTLRTEFDEWLAVQRNRDNQPPLFPDLVPPAPAPHDCARDGHLYEPTVTRWVGGPDERLTWTCAGSAGRSAADVEG